MDAEHIGRLYRSHGDLVRRRARALLGSAPEADEVLHDVFTSLVGDPQQFDGRSAFTTWLYSATTHRCLNLIRNRRRRAELLDAAHGPDAVAPPPEAIAMARQMLAMLPDDLAQIAVYYFFDEMTHDEIASVVGCSRRQVGKLIERIGEMSRTKERFE